MSTDFSNYHKGTVTSHGKITELLQKNDRFVIYEVDDSGYITYDSIDETIGQQYTKIQAEWTDILNHLTTYRDRKKNLTRMSAVLKECFLGNIDVAKDKLARIKASIIDTKTTQGRVEYLSGTLLATVLCTLALYIASYYVVTDNWPVLKTVFFGILGGTLSVCINLKSIVINTTSERTTVRLILGALRILIAAMASFIVYYFVKAEFILGPVQNETPYAFYAIGTLSGFSEAYITNILKKAPTP